MCKRITSILLLTVFLCFGLLTGCGSGGEEHTLPKIDYDGSALTGTVEYVNGQTCKVLLTEGDSHYDAEDPIYLNFSSVDGSKSVKVGDTVSFSYHYTRDVSEYNGEPCITVNHIQVS